MDKRLNIDACCHVYELLQEGNLNISIYTDPIYNSTDLSVVLNDNRHIKTKVKYCPVCGQEIIIKES